MANVDDSIIRDPSLAPSGQRKIDWVAQHAPVLASVAARELADGVLKGRRIAVVVHLEAKTAYLSVLLNEAGADVTVCGSNPLSTQDDVCAALVERGVRVFATHDPTPDEFERYLDLTIATAPELIVDDGAEVVARMVERRPELLDGVIGASEETTTGVARFRALDRDGHLPFPVLPANDARCKYLFDNRYGTGHSSLVSLLATTNLFLPGKAVVVIGFGWVGRGIARYAHALGAEVIVCETDPVKLLEAYAEGYRPMNSLDAAAVGDIFLTATGSLRVLGVAHFARMRDGALLANAGHDDHEIDVAWLDGNAADAQEVRRSVTQYRLADGRRLHLIARGRLVNLAAGDGHPVEIMDLTFAIQALNIHYLATHAGKLERGLRPVPAEIDERVALAKLRTLGVEPDRANDEQRLYTRG